MWKKICEKKISLRLHSRVVFGATLIISSFLPPKHVVGLPFLGPCGCKGLVTSSRQCIIREILCVILELSFYLLPQTLRVLVCSGTPAVTIWYGSYFVGLAVRMQMICRVYVDWTRKKPLLLIMGFRNSAWPNLSLLLIIVLITYFNVCAHVCMCLCV